MKTRQLAADIYAGLKATTRGFIAAGFGKQHVAAEFTRVEQQTISDYGSTNPRHAETFMPVDVLLDLIKASGNNSLLKYLADQSGCLLVPLPQGGMGEVEKRTARTAEEFGQVIAGVMSALSDQVITRSEGETILRDLRELMLEAAGLAEAVRAKVEADE